MADKNLNQIFRFHRTLNKNLVKTLMEIYELHISSTFLKNLQQNKQSNFPEVLAENQSKIFYIISI